MLDVSYWCINELLCMICVCVWLYVWKKWVERWRWWLMAGVGWCVGLSARRNVLEINLSDGLDNMGSVKASLAMCLMTVFLLVYFSLWKGVRSSGKVILSLHPFFFLLWFFICFFLCFFSPPPLPPCAHYAPESQHGAMETIEMWRCGVDVRATAAPRSAPLLFHLDPCSILVGIGQLLQRPTVGDWLHFDWNSKKQTERDRKREREPL